MPKVIIFLILWMVAALIVKYTRASNFREYYITRIPRYQNRLPNSGISNPLPEATNVSVSRCGSICLASKTCKSIFINKNGSCFLSTVLLNDHLYDAASPYEDITYNEIASFIHNIAMGKPAYCSVVITNFPSLINIGASKAVDGIRNGARFVGTPKSTYSCWITNSGAQFMYVDLQAQYYIQSVRIMGRQDCCNDRFRKIKISIGDAPTSTTTCAEFTGPPSKAGEIVVLQCLGVGRFVRLDKNTNNYFTLCELEVSGRPLP